MAAGHTPRPWILSENDALEETHYIHGPDFYVKDESGHFLDINDEDPPIASVPTGKTAEEYHQQLANARIMSAGLELLEAVEGAEVLELLEREYGPEDARVLALAGALCQARGIV